MPSPLHELLIDLFRTRPALAVDLLADVLGLHLPAYEQARLEPGDLNDVQPTEYRADAVVVLSRAGSPVLAVVVEVQLGRDSGKRWSWPVYVTTVQHRTRCPTELLVVCPTRAIARWCATPIPLGLTGSHLTPLVLGPDRVPVVTDPGDAARHPDLAALSAMAHGGQPDGEVVLDALISMFETVEGERARLYYDVVYEALPAAARAYLEELMTSATRESSSPTMRRIVAELAEGKAKGMAEGRVEGKAEGKVEGKAEGKAEALLTVLATADFTVSDEARSRITACADTVQLDAWLRRVRGATTIDDVLS